MKTEKELREIIALTKKETLDQIPDFKKAVQDENWESVVEYGNAFVMAAAVINVAEGFIS